MGDEPNLHVKSISSYTLEEFQGLGNSGPITKVVFSLDRSPSRHLLYRHRYGR